MCVCVCVCVCARARACVRAREHVNKYVLVCWCLYLCAHVHLLHCYLYTQVGKFGQGFSAVYNVTEVPSVYSGSTMAMLDPHQRYLPNQKPGKKMDFNNKMNKVTSSF